MLPCGAGCTRKIARAGNSTLRVKTTGENCKSFSRAGATAGEVLRGSDRSGSFDGSSELASSRGNAVDRWEFEEQNSLMLSAAIDAVLPRKPTFRFFEGDRAPV